MDEPLSNLDAKLRVQMRADIAALQARLGVTTVYVTHDQAEAMTLGHRVAVLSDGRLQQCDAPRALRAAREHVRGGLHRLAVDEPLSRPRVVERRGLARRCQHPCRRPRERRRASRRRAPPESLELAADGVPAEVEVVEEVGADAYVFCVTEAGRDDEARRPDGVPTRTERGTGWRCGRAPTRRTCSTPETGAGLPTDARSTRRRPSSTSIASSGTSSAGRATATTSASRTARTSRRTGPSRSHGARSRSARSGSRARSSARPRSMVTPASTTCSSPTTSSERRSSSGWRAARAGDVSVTVDDAALLAGWRRRGEGRPRARRPRRVRHRPRRAGVQSPGGGRGAAWLIARPHRSASAGS